MLSSIYLGLLCNSSNNCITYIGEQQIGSILHVGLEVLVVEDCAILTEDIISTIPEVMNKEDMNIVVNGKRD